MTFTSGDRTVHAPPGTFVLAPSGVKHGFRNDGDVPVRMLNLHAPAGFDLRIGLPAGRALDAGRRRRGLRPAAALSRPPRTLGRRRAGRRARARA